MTLGNDLDAKFAALDGKLKEQATQILALQTETTDHSEAIGDIDSRVDNLSNRITALTKRVTDLESSILPPEPAPLPEPDPEPTPEPPPITVGKTTVKNFTPEAGKTYKNLILDGGVQVTWKTINDVTLEDCDFVNASTLLAVQAHDTTGQGKCSGWMLRRCSFVGAVPSQQGGHSQGVFLRGVDNFKFEDCLFDHNGWYGDYRWSQNHNVYLDSRPVCLNGDVSFLRCRFIEACSQGIKMRGGNVILVDTCYFDANIIDIANDTRSPINEIRIKNCAFKNTGGKDSNLGEYGWSIHLKSDDASNPTKLAVINTCEWVGPGVPNPSHWQDATVAVKLEGSYLERVRLIAPNFNEWNGQIDVQNRIGGRLEMV